MAIGTVKWFNNSKGYGFICPTEGGEDIFVHFSCIEMEGYKSLKAGQEVFYEVNKGPKGLHASVIKPNEDNVIGNRDHSSTRERSHATAEPA